MSAHFNNITEEQLIKAGLDGIRKEDEKARKKQGLPRKRTIQESNQYRAYFENVYNTFVLKISNSQPVLRKPFDLEGIPESNSWGMCLMATTVPYTMTLALEERTGQPAEAEDIGKFCHILAARDYGPEWFSHTMVAFDSLSMSIISLSEGGGVSSVILSDIMVDKQNCLYTDEIMTIARKANCDKNSFYYSVFQLWYRKHNLQVPSPFR